MEKYLTKCSIPPCLAIFFYWGIREWAEISFVFRQKLACALVYSLYIGGGIIEMAAMYFHYHHHHRHFTNIILNTTINESMKIKIYLASYFGVIGYPLVSLFSWL